MGRFREELRRASRPEPVDVLRARGVSRGVLRGRRWVSVRRGYFRPFVDGDLSPTQRILDAAVDLPRGAVLGGWAAGYALGADRLDGRDGRPMAPIPISTILPRGLHRRSTPSVRYVQPSRLTPPDFFEARMVAGLPFTGPVATALDLARDPSGLSEVVVALDPLLAGRVLTEARLDSAAGFLCGGARAPQGRRAIQLCCPGVRSPWESRLRMFWVLELGLPSPLVNRPVFDLEGRFLGAPDLLDPEAGLAMEYDGASWSGSTTAGHRDPDRHREDNVREELLEKSGLIVVRADKVDLTRHREQLAVRLTSARADGLARDRRRDRWTLTEPLGWWGLPT